MPWLTKARERISAKLEQRFRQGKMLLRKESARSSAHEWLISNGRQQFLLSKRENA